LSTKGLSKEEKKVLIDTLNTKIKNSFCEKTFLKLNELTLINLRNTLSAQKFFESIKSVLLDFLFEKKIEICKENLVEILLPIFITSNIRSLVRTQRLQKLIQKVIFELDLKVKDFDVFFDENCPPLKFEENPSAFKKSSFCIIEKATQKELHGKLFYSISINDFPYAYYDFYFDESGGHRKYSSKPENIKILCVIYVENFSPLTSGSKTIVVNALYQGFSQNSTCTISNLKKEICNFFLL
jgi:hypothetical protein